jgi:hypothetical protein
VSFKKGGDVVRWVVLWHGRVEGLGWEVFDVESEARKLVDELLADDYSVRLVCGKEVL